MCHSHILLSISRVDLYFCIHFIKFIQMFEYVACFIQILIEKKFNFVEYCVQKEIVF